MSGLELLLPHSGGRDVCGSLCIHSAKLAVEAVVGFWHCVLDFHQPRFLKEVSGVGETCGETHLLFIEIHRFGKQRPLLVDFFQRTGTERA